MPRFGIQDQSEINFRELNCGEVSLSLLMDLSRRDIWSVATVIEFVCGVPSERMVRLVFREFFKK